MVPAAVGPEAGLDPGDGPVAARPPWQSFKIEDMAEGMVANLVEGRRITPADAIALARQAIGHKPAGARPCRSAKPCERAAGPGPWQAAWVGRAPGPGCPPGIESGS